MCMAENYLACAAKQKYGGGAKKKRPLQFSKLQETNLNPRYHSYWLMPTLRRFHAVTLLTGVYPVRAYSVSSFGAAARERVSVMGAALPCTNRQVSEGAYPCLILRHSVLLY